MRVPTCGTFWVLRLGIRGDEYLQHRKASTPRRPTPTLDALAARGVDVPDRVGDKLANEVEHNKRHNAVMQATFKMVSAVALTVGSVILSDKSDFEKTVELNGPAGGSKGCAVDVAELEGDESGGDWLPRLCRERRHPYQSGPRVRLRQHGGAVPAQGL